MLPAGGSPVGGRSRVGRGRTLLLGALLLVVVAGGVALLIEAIVSGFDAGDSTEAVAGHIDDFPPGSVTLRRLQSEAGSGGLVWLPDRDFAGEIGVFRDGCHPIYYAIDARRLSTDAARDLDRYRVEVRGDGTVVVDLGDLRRQDRGIAR